MMERHGDSSVGKMRSKELEIEIAEAAADAGTDVFAHALDIDSGAEVGLRSDEPVVTASVFKISVLTEYVRQVGTGEIDPASRVTVRAGQVTTGPTGLSVFLDDAELSLRDLALSMITVSDNAATDIVTAAVGVDRVNATMSELRLPTTVLLGDCSAMFATIHPSIPNPNVAEILAFMDEHSAQVGSMAVCTPELTNRSTPRESARLLQLLWTDQAADPAGCAEARRILGLQVWPHRLSSGFPRDDVKISGKTGTMGVVRNEVGVVEFPGGRRFAVAVFTRSHRYAARDPQADALIGRVAAALVGHLLKS